MSTVKPDAVLSFSLTQIGSGVAKFNRQLAERLDVPLGQLSEHKEFTHPLISVRSVESPERDKNKFIRQMGDVVDRDPETYDVFLHADAPDWMWEHAHKTYAANPEICKEGMILSHCPSIVIQTPIAPAILTVFTTGMAHKMQFDYHERLRDLLEATKLNYRVTFSTAFHESKSIEHSLKHVRNGLERVYGMRGFFAGFLSDGMLCSMMRQHDFVANFFPSGVRSNNTSVHAALEMACPVITNLDKFSHLVHEHTCFDIHQLDKMPSKNIAKYVGRKGRRFVLNEMTWEKLCDTIIHHT